MKLAWPFKMSLPLPTGGEPHVGLVIRPDAVEVLVVRGAKRLAHARVPIEGTGDEALAHAITKALASIQLTVRKAAVSIPTQDVLIRYFTIPPIPKPEWERAVQFEARKYLPFKIDDLVWGYSVLRPSGGRGAAAKAARLEVVFIGVPRSTLTRFRTILAHVEVQATTLEARSLSLARLVRAGKNQPFNEFTCLVEVEPASAHLAIVRDRLPYLTRDIRFTIPPADAAAANPTRPDPRAEHILSELRVSMDFFAREYPSAVLSKIVLIGEPSLVDAWRGWLAAQLQKPVEHGEVLLNAPIDRELPLSAASAIGLLRAQQERTEATLDLLARSPEKAVGARGAAKAFAVPKLLDSLDLSPRALVLTGFAAAAILAACWGLGEQPVAAARRQLEQARTSQAAVGHGLDPKDAQALEGIKTSANSQFAMLRALMDDRVRTAAKLDALARSLPEGVWLTSLQFQDQLGANGRSVPQLTVNGACYRPVESDQFPAIQDFEAQVKDNAVFMNGFSSAQLGQSTPQVDGSRRYTYRTFHLSCQSDSKAIR